MKESIRGAIIGVITTTIILVFVIAAITNIPRTVKDNNLTAIANGSIITLTQKNNDDKRCDSFEKIAIVKDIRYNSVREDCYWINGDVVILRDLRRLDTKYRVHMIRFKFED